MTKASGRRSRRPTMVDVAREAGVALSTVSRVVNDDPTVGAEFARRVRTAIDTLGYRPDEQAQQLRRGTSRTVGVAAREMSARNPLLAEFERGAYAAGLTVFGASTADDVDRERAVVLVDGPSRLRRRGGRTDRPRPLLPGPRNGRRPGCRGGRPPDRRPATDAVLADNAAGIRLAYQQLLDHGHTRIAYIGDHERIFTGRQRAAAFRACLAAEGRSETGLVHTGETDQTRISEALREILAAETPATALVCGNVTTTLAVLRTCPSRSLPNAAPRWSASTTFPWPTCSTRR